MTDSLLGKLWQTLLTMTRRRPPPRPADLVLPRWPDRCPQCAQPTDRLARVLHVERFAVHGVAANAYHERFECPCGFVFHVPVPASWDRWGPR